MILNRTFILCAFFFSCNVFASESASKLTDFGRFFNPRIGCEGRLYETPTEYNSISTEGQELWKLHDDIVSLKGEYNALNLHLCRVHDKKNSSKILITKFEVHPGNEHIDRSLDTFLSCLVVNPVLFNSEIIYAWIPKTDEESLLKILTQSYLFKKSKIKLKDSDGNTIKKPKDITQLKVKIGKLDWIEKNTWLQAQLAS